MYMPELRNLKSILIIMFYFDSKILISRAELYSKINIAYSTNILFLP